ncbi:MAG: hypothetical protein LBH95_00220 [Oscillospiraceae bacterium]|jgi:uncharacterized protein YdeI (YjbR/CyaY-like superfamily)|nr:hypothetical protein [Oscillospiraceae bacterium]
MSNGTFIGIGRNPDGVDLPLGLGMRLAQEPRAMETFGALDEAQRNRVVDYIQAAVTGGDAKDRIETAVCSLRDGHLPA